MNDKSILIYDHGYALCIYEYDIAIIYKSDVINESKCESKRMIRYQLYNKFRIKLDQKGLRFNAYKFV